MFQAQNYDTNLLHRVRESFGNLTIQSGFDLVARNRFQSGQNSSLNLLLDRESDEMRCITSELLRDQLNKTLLAGDVRILIRTSKIFNAGF